MSVPTIYLADDDADDRMVIARALEGCRKPHVLRFAENGEELLARLRTGVEVPDLIILDLNMPRKNGRDTASELKKDARFGGVPLIVLTTSEAPQDREWSMGAGVDAFHVKPSSFREMASLAERVLERWLAPRPERESLDGTTGSPVKT